MEEQALRRSFDCDCGRTHTTTVEDVIIGRGVIARLPEVLARYGASRVFILSDYNTNLVAGQKAAELIHNAGLSAASFVFPHSPKPSEEYVGSAVEHYDPACDAIVTVGSGVLCDIGKILSSLTGKPYIVIATAPSCDAYASATSSMERDGLKVSLPTRAPNVLIGDTDILKTAPDHMLQAGFGDMLAKYVSLCEWRLSHIINGEYYCPAIAQMMRAALDKCVAHREGLMRREDDAVAVVFEGLVIGGVAMAYAGVSRPASGAEHYMSHVWDMRALQFGTPADLHGIQCGIATLLCAKVYEQIKKMKPDREKALSYVAAFDYEDWKKQLRAFVGDGADAMIAIEAREHKYDVARHKARLERIIDCWDEIISVIDEELPSAAEIEAILDAVGAPKTPEAIGIDSAQVAMTFRCAKDIRDKYVLPRLCWDLGVLEKIKL
ncbi:MAG: sn-glycerol-1-phosphate dehydrogenase [Oscillospiraceae bacterium]|nr:sn-glycerol-1-phosphate dehydrogenase [Oscillospiraceae bacterium]